MSDSWVKKTATVKFMRVYERLVVGTLWYTSLPVYEWRVYMERKTFHDKFMSGSWAGYEWMILGAPDSWNHTRHWYCIFLGTLPSLLATKTKLSWASHEKIMRGSWVGAPAIPKEPQTICNYQKIFLCYVSQFLFGGYWGSNQLKLDPIRANGHAKPIVYEWFMRSLWVVHE